MEIKTQEKESVGGPSLSLLSEGGPADVETNVPPEVTISPEPSLFLSLV